MKEEQKKMLNVLRNYAEQQPRLRDIPKKSRVMQHCQKQFQDEENCIYSGISDCLGAFAIRLQRYRAWA